MNKKLSLLLASCTMYSTAVEAQQQPNIIVMFVDDLGWADLGYQNPQFETPNINKLKQKGINFTRAYVSTATSSPSRASLLTGKEALRCGFVRHIYGGGTEEFETFAGDPRKMLSRAWLPLDEVTYAEKLKQEGYNTAHVGKWHLGSEEFYPHTQGFDKVFATTDYGSPKSYYYPFFRSGNPFSESKKGDYLTDLVSNSAVEYINNYSDDKPFLLNVWFYTVHGPHVGRKDLVEKYIAKGYEGKIAHHHAMVESLDMAVGNILGAIESKDVADNTVVIFTSDQGGHFSNYPLSGGKSDGNTLGEGGTRVPFILYSPNSPAMGKRYNKPIQTIDVFPTLVEYATNKRYKDKNINGVSLMPIVEGGDIKSRNLFLHRSYEDQHCALIQDDWKLIRYSSGKLELFNIENDISETTNLVEVHPKRVEKMNKILGKWLEEATPKELITVK